MSEVAGTVRPPRLASLRQQVDHFLIESNGAIFVALIGLIIFFTIASPNQAFLSPFGIRSMVLAGSSILVVAVGATFVLIAGQIDLSIGAVLVLAGVIGIDVMTRVVIAGLGDEVAIVVGCVGRPARRSGGGVRERDAHDAAAHPVVHRDAGHARHRDGRWRSSSPSGRCRCRSPSS